jgi:hypothetical protein
MTNSTAATQPAPQCLVDIEAIRLDLDEGDGSRIYEVSWCVGVPCAWVEGGNVTDDLLLRLRRTTELLQLNVPIAAIARTRNEQSFGVAVEWDYGQTFKTLVHVLSYSDEPSVYIIDPVTPPPWVATVVKQAMRDHVARLGSEVAA